jgi:hypothetical protein
VAHDLDPHFLRVKPVELKDVDDAECFHKRCHKRYNGLSETCVCHIATEQVIIQICRSPRFGVIGQQAAPEGSFRFIRAGLPGTGLGVKGIRPLFPSEKY